MFVLGLTGSIGMGKSATAGMFRARGIPVHDSDASVHALYSGAAVAPVEEAFPGVAKDGVVDRAELAARVLGDASALKRLEAIVHPLVRAEAERFADESKRAGAPLVVLDVPLLFEGKREGVCDAILVVTAPADVQRARVLARPGMTPEKFQAILAKQTPDAEKRRRAHFVVDTSLGFDSARRAVDDIVRALAGRAGRAR
ncbi:MAG: dephospho-CoA kinase [Rhizobiales bacterium 65-9]|nr:dephospho-CoA kinase [Hyphomicrobiales bacterium]OJY34601.1 MAG: dephospho-CoA kinase [Rhizobiales bacterium 65-9]